MKSVISGREIPKDLQGIKGLTTGFDPPDAQESRIVITGQPGAGKSNFLNSNPYLMMLDPEQGGKTVADPNAMRFTPPPSVALKDLDTAYMDFVDRLIARFLGGKRDIRMIGIDTIDEFILLFQKALCLREGAIDTGDVGGGHGKGYFMVRDAVFGMLDRVHKAGMGWAIIAHTKTRYVKVGEQEKLVFSLGVSDSYKSAVFQKCEHMLFTEYGILTTVGDPIVNIVRGVRVEKPGKRENKGVLKLKTQPGGLWTSGSANDVKVRVPFEAEMVLPEQGGWDTFVSAYDKAVELLQDKKEKKDG